MTDLAIKAAFALIGVGVWMIVGFWPGLVMLAGGLVLMWATRNA
jgi:hypothetical protein